MSLIICLETATSACSVALVNEGVVIGMQERLQENVHAENLTLYVQQLLEEHQLEVHQLNAVAISMGPGSYTGLRIGVSVAKGLCFGANLPLIAINTLEAMAAGVMRSQQQLPADAWLCPMIDARRMEVYCAAYDQQMHCQLPTAAEIIDEHSFAGILAERPMVFFGNGAHKCKEALQHHTNSLFLDDIHPSAKNMAAIAQIKFHAQNFENLAYFEPYYLKEFVGTTGLKKA